MQLPMKRVRPLYEKEIVYSDTNYNESHSING